MIPAHATYNSRQLPVITRAQWLLLLLLLLMMMMMMVVVVVVVLLMMMYAFQAWWGRVHRQPGAVHFDH